MRGNLHQPQTRFELYLVSSTVSIDVLFFTFNNSARRSQMLAFSLMVFTAVKTRIPATTVYPALLATQDHSRLAKV